MASRWEHEPYANADVKQCGLGVDSCAIFVVSTALAVEIDVRTEIGLHDVETHLCQPPDAGTWWDTRIKSNGTGDTASERSVYLYETFTGRNHPGMPINLYHWSKDMAKKSLPERLKHFLKPSMTDEKKGELWATEEEMYNRAKQ